MPESAHHMQGSSFTIIQLVFAHGWHNITSLLTIAHEEEHGLMACQVLLAISLDMFSTLDKLNMHA